MVKAIIISVIIGLLGSILHFAYEWSGRKKIVALFSAVNESVWEHIKIALVPTIIFCAISPIIYGYGYFFVIFGELHFYFSPQIFVPMAATLLSIIILIPLLFYPILAIMKKHNVVVSIIEFFVAIFLSQVIFTWVLDMPGFPGPSNPFLGFCGGDATGVISSVAPCYTQSTIIASIIIIILVVVSVPLFTLFPPKFFLFRDSRNGKYGLAATESHNHNRKRRRH